MSVFNSVSNVNSRVPTLIRSIGSIMFSMSKIKIFFQRYILLNSLKKKDPGDCDERPL